MDYRRQVTLRRDGEDFVVARHTDGLIVFRNDDADALRKLCRSLRWEIIPDAGSAASGDSASSLVPAEPDAAEPEITEPERGRDE
jgi:hypothetical protein